MKKAPVKKTRETTKKSAPAGKRSPVVQQPQSKQQAAIQVGLFLHTDDAWSEAYFNNDDLHCRERELFG